jgi:hypothetical protein
VRQTQEANAQGSSGSSSGRSSARRRATRRRYLVWALLVVLALVPFVVIEGPAAGWLRDLGLLDRDERFTELFFPDRRALPATATVGSPITFDVAVRNREGEATSYRWKAVVSSGGRDSDLARGHVRMNNGEVRRIHVAGTAPEPPGPAVVRVTLVARRESIDFRTTIVPVASGATPSSG